MIELPRISIVTPSYNQAEFLEKTILSVLNQDYPNLEYIIVDGGSTDGSIEIIRSYEKELAWWVSEPDRGQVHALNKGFKRSTGDWVAWQNSDDIYYPGAFHAVANAANNNPMASIISGDMMLIDKNDKPLREILYVRPTYSSLLAEGMVIANQASFWKREIQIKLGKLDENYHCSFDYEWFLRLTEHSKCHHIKVFLGALRLHDESKTSLLGKQFQYENEKILTGRKLPAWKKFLYQLRRTILMIMNGNAYYVFRGLRRRINGSNYWSI